MKILDSRQIYQADKFTIEKNQISGAVLMERAAEQLFNWIHTQLQGAPVRIHLFCGIGNNGGDGIALARYLLEHDYDIRVYVVNYSEKRSAEFLLNLDRLKDKKTWPDFLKEHSDFPVISEGDMVVDAIFGIGLSRPPARWVMQLMDRINGSGAFIISVDVPSGRYTDGPTPYDGGIEADMVLSIQLPKLIFFLPGSAKYVKEWEAVDIGLDDEYISGIDVSYSLSGLTEARKLYKPRKRFSHKGHYGHSVIIGGSYGKVGAVQLSAGASLAAGSGLVSVYVPECGYIPLQTALPEAMVLTDKNKRILTHIEIPFKPAACGIGPGMGTQAETVSALSGFLEFAKSPLVLDADALNILSSQREILAKLPAGCILTPHPGELKRLIGDWEHDFDKLQKAKDFSVTYNCILVLKDACTIVIYQGKGYINNSGNPGLATGGTGDVLTGIITGLLAQGYSQLEAAVLGVYLHGLAADLAVGEHGQESLTAGKLIDYIGKAYLHLYKGGKGK